MAALGMALLMAAFLVGLSAPDKPGVETWTVVSTTMSGARG